MASPRSEFYTSNAAIYCYLNLSCSNKKETQEKYSFTLTTDDIITAALAAPTYPQNFHNLYSKNQK